MQPLNGDRRLRPTLEGLIQSIRDRRRWGPPGDLTEHPQYSRNGTQRSHRQLQIIQKSPESFAHKSVPA